MRAHRDGRDEDATASASPVAVQFTAPRTERALPDAESATHSDSTDDPTGDRPGTAHAMLALASLPGIGPVRAREWYERAGSASAAWTGASADVGAAVAERAWRVAGDALARLTMVPAAFGAAVRPPAAAWAIGDAEYPESLLALPAPPPVLFALGDPTLLARPRIAIVGTRGLTRYGESVTRELAAALARAGACVISGMARGVDGVAHRAALDAGGATVAVLGTGIDVPYPTSHRELHAAIVSHGLVVAERTPGSRPTAGAFPARNRIIAGLAEVTIVVEAGMRSGALLTAMHAMELGRTVAAVPGPIDSAQSAGTNELLRDGAVVIASVADALALVGLTPAPRQPRAGLDAESQRVWDALARGAVDLDTLAARTGLPVRACLTAVTELELAGAVTCEMTGEVRRAL